jgi:hypothetical protein
VQVEDVARLDWGMNTDLDAVFELILRKAQAASLPPEHMVRTLFIFSVRPDNVRADLLKVLCPVLIEQLVTCDADWIASLAVLLCLVLMPALFLGRRPPAPLPDYAEPTPATRAGHGVRRGDSGELVRVIAVLHELLVPRSAKRCADQLPDRQGPL